MTTVKTLTRLLAALYPGHIFTLEALAAVMKASMDHLLTGGMDRETFERRLFDFADLSPLPIGHLQDHRVHMPDDIAANLLAGSTSELSMLLSNMLCSTHPQGAELVSEALGLDLFDDAYRLQAVHRINPEFAVRCLTGWLGAATPMLAKAADNLPQFQATVVSSAIYYGALQHQIIGLRLRAISEFRFGVDDGALTDTMGGTVDDIYKLFAALRKSNDGVHSEKKLLGRTPDLIRLAKPIGKKALSETLRLRPEITEEALLAELRELYGALYPIIERFSETFVPNSEEDTHLSADQSESDTMLDSGGLRARMPTVISGGVTGGQQLAFASLRLHAFARRLRRCTAAGDGYPGKFNDWFEANAGRQNKDVAKLVLVSTSAVWAKTQNFPAFRTDGSPDDLRIILNRSQGIPNEDLLSETIRNYRGWTKNNGTASIGHSLKGSQAWDIIPQFLFENSVPTNRDQKSPNLGYEIGAHNISPRHRAPKASHRFC